MGNACRIYPERVGNSCRTASVLKSTHDPVAHVAEVILVTLWRRLDCSACPGHRERAVSSYRFARCRTAFASQAASALTRSC